jgi:hypothetical protein
MDGTNGLKKRLDSLPASAAAAAKREIAGMPRRNRASYVASRDQEDAAIPLGGFRGARPQGCEKPA